MKIGLQLVTYDTPVAERLAQTAWAAEAAGLASLWTMDHLQQVPAFGAPDDLMLEAYTALGYLAGVTHKIGLGAMVSNASVRLPGLLAKCVETLDYVSVGRAYAGVGAGWYVPEADAFGYSLAERWARLVKALAALRRHCPHVPIWIGGRAQSRTLHLAALYADGYSFHPGLARSATEIQDALERLRRVCEECGRDPAELTRSITVPLRPEEGATEILRRLEMFRALDFDHVVVNAADASQPEWVEWFGQEVVPRLS